jgi:type II secretory pathway component PulF
MTFKYKAKKGVNEWVEGVVEAASRDEAVDKINELGLLPIDVWGADEKKSRSEPRRPPVVKKVKTKNLITFYRQLSKLIKSGISVPRALNLVSQEHEHPGLRKILGSVLADVRSGASLSSALRAFPAVFTPFDVGLLSAGESAGRIDESLGLIAAYHEQQEDFVSKVRSAMAYPTLVLAMGGLTLGVMITQVIPKFSRFFQDLGQDLPFLTKVLIAVSEWSRANLVWGLLAAGAFFFAARITLRRPQERVRFDRSILRIPKLGGLFLKIEIARFARTLELLLKSGIALPSATRNLAPIAANHAVRAELEACARGLEEGGPLSEGLRKSGLFPGFVCHLVALGEESGRLDEALGEIAEWYEKEVSETLKVITALLEPAVILIIGVILALVIIAVLLPVFSINTMIAA